MREIWTVTVFGLVIAMLGPIFVAVVSERAGRPPNRLRPLLLAQAALVAIVAAVLSVVFFFEHKPASSIGLKPLTLQSFAWGLALAAFFMYVFSPVVYWTLRRFRLGGFDKCLLQLQGLPVWYLVLAVVIGGVAEEILYRGYAVERIATLTGSLWFAGAIPVVVFAAAHVPMWGWGPALATLVPGAILTVFYLWQRDLAACIIAHVVTDFAGIVIGPLVASRRAS
ncbi:MAG: CPBP family intramembrane glutamic endopeptidase [Burkholderiales bacterium]